MHLCACNYVGLIYIYKQFLYVCTDLFAIIVLCVLFLWVNTNFSMHDIAYRVQWEVIIILYAALSLCIIYAARAHTHRNTCADEGQVGHSSTIYSSQLYIYTRNFTFSTVMPKVYIVEWTYRSVFKKSFNIYYVCVNNLIVCIVGSCNYCISIAISLLMDLPLIHVSWGRVVLCSNDPQTHIAALSLVHGPFY